VAGSANRGKDGYPFLKEFQELPPAMSVTETYPCDLCQLPVELAGFELSTTEGRKRFCCEGCQGIYRMLHEDELVDGGSEPEPG
jgi:hypothetical protein